MFCRPLSRSDQFPDIEGRVMRSAVFPPVSGTLFEEKIAHPCCVYDCIGNEAGKITRKAKEREGISQIIDGFSALERGDKKSGRLSPPLFSINKMQI